MNHSICVGLSCLTLLCPFTVCTQEPPHPERGLLRIEGTLSAMEYACIVPRENVISCKFIELDVWEPRRVSHEDAVNSQRVCTFAAHPFEQTLKRTVKGASGEIEWVTASGPSGECQVLRRSRFIGRKIDQGIEWEYIVELKTLDNSKENGPLRCGELKEVEARYSWQGAYEAPAECGKVRFNGSCFSPDFPCLSGGAPVTSH
jgi:hypothetical protein